MTLRKFINWITLGRLGKPIWEPIYLYVNDRPVAIFGYKNRITGDMHVNHVIEEKPTFSFQIVVEDGMTDPDYSDLDATLNTLGIPLQSDLEAEGE